MNLSALLLVFYYMSSARGSNDHDHDHDHQTYIVQLHPQRAKISSKLDWHLSLLQQVVSSQDDASARLLYSYDSAMEGFAATLSETELHSLKTVRDVMSVRPDRRLEIHTTYSYKFLGLNTYEEHGAWRESNFGRGSIIGLLDTGAWPESPSFDDTRMPPVPKKWRGVCQSGEQFNSKNCNRKLIGARFFYKGHSLASATSLPPSTATEYLSPRDSRGHGTHTASTAAGVSVPMASVLGNGAGVAHGMAPGAHIAIYKVCWYSGCYSSDILAAMDVAIGDGVDILSLSLGGFPVPLYDDSIAIGSYRAVQHGISVICAAGNNGPIQSSVANEAPWITTVGASTLDRTFPAFVKLGNGDVLYGESLYPGKNDPSTRRELEVVYITGDDRGSQYCFRGSLPESIVRGKMVVCDRGASGRAEKGQAVKEAGGAAMILTNMEINQEDESVDVHVLPATLIGYKEALTLKRYINSSTRPVARILFKGTVVGKTPAPAVAQFSSRGPSLTDPSILKPDVIAPGVNIIAAWPQNLGPTGLPEDTRRVNFTVMSGTSMSCPHVSGIAALIRTAYPKWSPAAIRSALMTTADINNHNNKPIMDGEKPADIFAIGAGHVNPERAVKPGLVYDIKPSDYIIHLCTLGYAASDIYTITHTNVSCCEILQKNKGFSLNYPSISVKFDHKKTTKMIRRRLTNVGNPSTTYTAEIMAPEGIKVRIKPHKLIFKRRNQNLGYRVWFISRKRKAAENTTFAQGQLTSVFSNSRCVGKFS